MIFSEIKGLRPQNSKSLTLAVILLVAEILGIAGYLGGYFSDARKWHTLGDFNWTTEVLIYTTLAWLAWMVTMAVLVLTKKESLSLKIGAGVFVSLPMLAFWPG